MGYAHKARKSDEISGCGTRTRTGYENWACEQDIIQKWDAGTSMKTEYRDEVRVIDKKQDMKTGYKSPGPYFSAHRNRTERRRRRLTVFAFRLRPISGLMDKSATIILQITSRIALLERNQNSRSAKGCHFDSNRPNASGMINSNSSQPQTVWLHGRSTGGACVEHLLLKCY